MFGYNIKWAMGLGLIKIITLMNQFHCTAQDTLTNNYKPDVTRYDTTKYSRMIDTSFLTKSILLNWYETQAMSPQ